MIAKGGDILVIWYNNAVCVHVCMCAHACARFITEGCMKYSYVYKILSEDTCMPNGHPGGSLGH